MFSKGGLVNPILCSPEIVAFSKASSTLSATAFVNCLPIAELAAFLKFSFVMFSAIVLPTAESRTFFATPESITFLAIVELAALFTADVNTLFASLEV